MVGCFDVDPPCDEGARLSTSPRFSSSTGGLGSEYSHAFTYVLGLRYLLYPRVTTTIAMNRQMAPNVCHVSRVSSIQTHC